MAMAMAMAVVVSSLATCCDSEGFVHRYECKESDHYC